MTVWRKIAGFVRSTAERGLSDDLVVEGFERQKSVWWGRGKERKQSETSTKKKEKKIKYGSDTNDKKTKGKQTEATEKRKGMTHQCTSTGELKKGGENGKRRL